MSWKDWLYIPKSDKIAIMALSAVILASILFSLVSNKKTNNQTVNLSDSIPQEYREWELKLYKNIEEEPIQYPTDKSNNNFTRQRKLKEGEKIELNSADTNQLKMIPGIGSMYAGRIVKYRNALGGYTSIEQLNEVWGLDTYLYSEVEPYFTLNVQHDSIHINTDDFDKLIKHPYLNYKQVTAIIDIRERKGSIKSMKRLALLEEFKKRDLERLTSYISFKDK